MRVVDDFIFNFFKKANEKYDINLCLADINIRYSLRAKGRFGSVKVKKDGSIHLLLHKQLLLECEQKYIKSILPHDLIHILVYFLYHTRGITNIRPHGKEFYSVGYKMGLSTAVLSPITNEFSNSVFIQFQIEKNIYGYAFCGCVGKRHTLNRNEFQQYWLFACSACGYALKNYKKKDV